MIVSALEKLQVRQQIPDNFRQNTKDTQILFHIRRTTTNMEMTMILTIVVLNILLPSHQRREKVYLEVDTFGDLFLEVQHFIEKVLEAQIKRVHTLLGCVGPIT